jgi:O-acetyl-ADP-ribose deacetylase (regulator of RNase III)
MDFNQLIGKKGAYAGIGSRKITRNSSIFLMKYACCMAFAGMKVNQGAADGSDTSFEWGAKIAYDAMCELDQNLIPGNYSMVQSCFMPWSGFNGREGGVKEGYIDYIHPDAETYTSKFHPGWDYLKPPARKMMARNSMQILSETLSNPVKFVACETPDGAFTTSMTSGKTGGTGQAIRIADHHGIPVYNMKNAEHKLKAELWIAEFDIKIQGRFGVSPIGLVDDFIEKYKGFKKSVEGDLVRESLNGQYDVLIHGCNCMNAMGSGIAKSIKDVFPEAYLADQQTRKGDKSKLGTYTHAKVNRNGNEIIIVNAYTQFKWGRENELYADYEAIRKVFKQIALDFPGKRVGIPRIGAGLSNGCWVTVSNIISTAMKNCDLTLVDLPEGKMLELYMDEKAKVIKESSPQMGMGF